MAKRLFDIGLALLLLPLAVMLCLPVAAAIRLETPGHPLFRQVRVGHRQTPFVLWKLRSMAKDTTCAGSHEVGAEALTGIGRLIRRCKIDELPQIWNVLRGDMSFVGPRPCLPSQSEVIAERAARGVFEMRPGITGLAQLRGVDMSTPRRLAQTDAAYLESPSFTGDLWLIFGTVAGRGQGDAARQV
jgi:lipopolysaccharide/colanic/teichoic acid biosynthesis glycosyltransferase